MPSNVYHPTVDESSRAVIDRVMTKGKIKGMKAEGKTMERATESDAASNRDGQAAFGLGAPLAWPVMMRDGISLVLGDLRSFLFKRLQLNRRESPNWQHVIGLLLRVPVGT
jgi:hypothetical protein